MLHYTTMLRASIGIFSTLFHMFNLWLMPLCINIYGFSQLLLIATCTWFKCVRYLIWTINLTKLLIFTWKKQQQILCSFFLTVSLDVVYLSWGEESREVNRFTKFFWKLTAFKLNQKSLEGSWAQYRLSMWFCGIVPTILLLYMYYADLKDKMYVNLDQANEQTDNLLPFIVCVHLFSIS